MRYLEETLGIKVRYHEWKGTKTLPFLIVERYNFKQVELDDIHALFMYVKGSMDSIASVKKHVLRVREKSEFPVVLVLNECLPRQRKSLIHARIPFVMENKQIYLPFMGSVLEEKYSCEEQAGRKLSPAAQVVFLYFLYCKTVRLPMKEVENSLNFSAMSITRAVKQLEQLNIITTYKEGVNKIIFADCLGKELFEKADPWLQSPVRHKVYVNEKDVKDHWLQAGYQALSECSMLGAPRWSVYAVKTISGINYEEERMDDRQVEVEVWSYDPEMLADSAHVDILSLYESLKEDPDERVQGAVEEMMSSFWGDYE